jgi:hypothetical protein
MPEWSPDFPDWLKREVDQVADQYGGLPRDRAFPVMAASWIYDIDKDAAVDRTDTLILGDGGVDGWLYDDRNQIFVLMQAKWSDDPEMCNRGADELDDLIRAFAAINGPREPLGQMPNRLLQLAADYDTAVQNGAGIVLCYFVAGRVTSGARNALETAALGIANCAVEFFDLAQMSSLRGSEQLIEDLAGVVVDFECAAGTKPMKLLLPVDGSDIEVAVAALDGRKLGDAAAPHQPAIYHANIRYQLGHRNKVNKGMRDTLKEPLDRGKFWLYNNGLTIVCTSFQVTTDGTKIQATNPQIVNGAQTTSTLSDLRAMISPGEVAVQTRFIALDPAQLATASELLTEISRFTNSQSPVKPSDLRSNEPRHLALQRSLDSLANPVFYERRRGEWTALTAAQRIKYGSPARRVSKEDIGQRWRAYAGQPADSIAKKDELFEDQSVESGVFDPTRSGELFMLAYELFESALSLMKAQNAGDLKTLVPGWFPAGLEAARLVALRKGARLTAAHAAALAREVLIWRYGAVGRERGLQLRDLLQSSTEENSKLWRVVFRTMFLWSHVHEPVELKSLMQSDNAFDLMKSLLQNELADKDKASFLPSLI